MRKIFEKLLTAACVCAMVSFAVPAYAAEGADAYTTATENYVSGKFGSFDPGEGIMANDAIREKIADLLGGRKNFKLYVLGTSYNNVPVTTNAEWTLDNETLTFYGIHEKNTEKLIHMKQNPDVSLSWNEGHFEGFSNMRGIQMNGKAEVIPGTSPDFEAILINYIPYEEYQAMMGGAPLATVRGILASMMEISKITINRATIANTDFKADGFRTYQRWSRGIALSSFTAQPGNRSVTIEWTTTKEASDITGFNIYRSEKGSAYEKVNAELIDSKGPAGGSYSYTDTGLRNWHKYTYALASLDNASEETYYSTVTAQPRFKYLFVK